ncbi:MAG: hypothetical protein AAB692_00335 [Patescibacteria group bacterium]
MLVPALFWFALAFIVACIEIESEGKWGWAEKAPTWFRTTGVVGKTYGLLMGGKPFTGYHLFMFLLPPMMFHIPFVSGLKLTLAAEFNVWALFFVWCPLWDYLWFVLNPEFGAAGFKKDKVWWYANSIWIFGLFPADYLIAAAISFAFAGGAQLAGKSDALAGHAALLTLFLFMTAMTIAASPLYHRWYRYMRRSDDRDKAGIFHR